MREKMRIEVTREADKRSIAIYASSGSTLEGVHRLAQVVFAAMKLCDEIVATKLQVQMPVAAHLVTIREVLNDIHLSLPDDALDRLQNMPGLVAKELGYAPSEQGSIHSLLRDMLGVEEEEEGKEKSELQ